MSHKNVEARDSGELEGQLAIDEADAAAGYRQVADEEGEQLSADDPNVAAGQGDHDHENHIGEELPTDPAAAADGEDLDSREAG